MKPFVIVVFWPTKKSISLGKGLTFMGQKKGRRGGLLWLLNAVVDRGREECCWWQGKGKERKEERGGGSKERGRGKRI